MGSGGLMRVGWDYLLKVHLRKRRRGAAFRCQVLSINILNFPAPINEDIPLALHDRAVQVSSYSFHDVIVLSQSNTTIQLSYCSTYPH